MKIKSKTKKPLTKDELSSLVKDSFGNEAEVKKVQELHDGYFNTAYLLEIVKKDGKIIDTVLKVAPIPEMRLMTYENDCMNTEMEVFKILKENGSIPVPNVLGYNFRHDIVKRDCLFTEKLIGTSWDKVKLSKEDKKKLKHELGVINARVNSIKGNFYGYFSYSDKSYNKTWKSAFSKMMQNVLDDGIALKVDLKKICKKNPEEIMDLILKKGAIPLDEVTEPQLVHWDLWKGNIFVKNKNNHYFIDGITDTERAFWGDPLMEFGFMNIKKEKDFQNGYESEGGNKYLDSRGQQIRRCMYNIYLGVIMVIEPSSRLYEGFIPFIVTQYGKFVLKSNLKKLEKF
ncbi:MAG: aminoglycoside phosphotransferase family protein [archaeon]|nr:aminoglycoside phosphotransferase family protein [archaeon]